MNYLIYAALSVLLLMFLGIGLAILITPKEIKKYALLLAPAIGYSYLTLAGWHFYLRDFKGTDASAQALAIPPSFFLIFAGWKLRKTGLFSGIQRLIEKEFVAPLIIAVLSFIVASSPFFLAHDTAKMSGLTSISLGNNDIADSASIATYLKEHARTDRTGFLGQSDIFRYLADVAIFGGSYFTAFSSTFFSLETYQLQSMSLQLFFFIGTILFFILAREGFHYSQTVATFVTAIFAFHPIMYFIMFHGFQGQLLATSLSLLFYVANLTALQYCRSLLDYVRYLPINILTLWAISLTYPVILPFVIAPLLIYAALRYLVQREFSGIHFAAYMLASIVFITAVSTWRTMEAAKYFLLMGRTEAGWFFPLLSLDKWLGWTWGDRSLQHGPGLISGIISIILATTVALGIWKQYWQKRDLALLAVSFLLPILGGYLILGFTGQVNGHWGGYRSFKFVAYYLPVLLLSSFLIIDKYLPQLTRHSRNDILLALGLTALIIMPTGSTLYLTTRMVRHHSLVDEGLANLTEIATLDRIQSINVLSKDCWDTLWIVNFLLNKKLYFETSTYAGRKASPLKGNWNLFRRGQETVDSLPSKADMILVPGGYILQGIPFGNSPARE